MDGRSADALVGVHRLLDDGGNRRERETILEKCRDSDLVRGVQNNGESFRARKRTERKLETPEVSRVGPLEIETPGPREIQRRQRRAPSLGIRERILDRQPHV